MASRLQPTHKAGPGRPKGSKNNPNGPKHPKRVNPLLEAERERNGGLRTRRPGIIRKLTSKETSLDFLRMTYTDHNVPMSFRTAAAQAAAPYEHKKMPIAIEGTDKPIPIINASELGSMSTEQLAALASALAALGLGASEDKDG